MTRATGGSAWAATSTRSRFFEKAYSRASCVCLTPTCDPSSSISRTRGTRIASLIRACCWTGRTGSTCRLGLKGRSPSCFLLPRRTSEPLQAAARRPRRSTRFEPPTSSRSGGEERVRSCLPELESSKLPGEPRHARSRPEGSGRSVWMAQEDTHPREDDRNEELGDSPAPDPEEKD